jgi:hypothetical protein
MKAKLEFDLDDPNIDDGMNFKMAVKASDYYWALYDFKNSRKSLEWELDSNENMSKHDALYKIFDKFWAIIEDHNITFEH